jgi:hypothetical protein
MDDIRLIRLESNAKGTLGVLLPPAGTAWCYTLEDPARDGPKIPGATRIPAGRYELKLRREGGFHARYLARFGAEFHRGMLHLQGVPEFTWVLLHCGNAPEDTAGCPLVGEVAIQTTLGPRLRGSQTAYQRVYPPIAAALERGERLWLRVEHADA